MRRRDGTRKQELLALLRGKVWDFASEETQSHVSVRVTPAQGVREAVLRQSNVLRGFASALYEGWKQINSIIPRLVVLTVPKRRISSCNRDRMIRENWLRGEGVWSCMT